ncbi:AMP-binding protein, partial [Cohnella sp. CFH 77786]|uniref:condensation domain-containing protein n=1 Tax=Cohnella sp. CFH 77786 TaxID=2662265 RepID=UPI001C60F808
MKPFGNLADVLEFGAATGKGIVFIHKKSETRMTYRELYDRGLAAAARLRAGGCRPRDEIVIRTEDPQAFVTSFWGCILGGLIPVPLAAGGSEEHRAKLRQVWARLNRPRLLADTDDFTAEDEPWRLEGGFLAAEVLAEEGEAPLAHAELPYRPSPEEIAFVQFSSGSTGEPKGVVLTHSNLLSNLGAIVACSGTTDRDSSLSWMPLTHDMGLIGFHLAPIYAGMEQYLMRPSQFMLDPMLWLAKAHEHRITSLASPNFGYRHFLACFKPEEAQAWDLGCVRLIFNGAEPISAGWAGRFLREMEPYGLSPSAMFPVYGLAEGTLAVTFPPAGEGLTSVRLSPDSLRIGGSVRLADAEDERAVTFVDVGTPVADCEVRIAGETGDPLPEGRIGHILIRGRNVTSGYYNAPEASGQAIGPDGWLRTGDIGLMRGGRLVITGRHKDIIFVRGQNVYPHDLETRAEAVEGVGYGKAAACGVPSSDSGEDEIVVFIQHKGGLEKFAALAERLRRRMNRETGLDVGRVVPVRHLPRTTSGKIQRYKLVERLVSGEWDGVLGELESLRHSEETAAARSGAADADTAHPDMLRMLTVWREALGTGSVGPDDHFQELGGNSLKAALALTGIRREWGAELAPRDLYDCPTPRLLLERLRSVNARAAAEWDSLPEAPRREDGLYPASIAQRRMALAEQALGMGCAYHIPVALAADGPLDADKLRAVLQELTDRHETLRTSFRWERGELVQRIHPAGTVGADFEVIDCGGRFPDPVHADDAAFRDAFEPFDLSRAPAMRARLWTDGKERHLLILNVHHIASDGIGMNVLTREFAALLNGDRPARPKRHYKDYAHWERDAGEALRKPDDEAYWREELRSPIPALEWPDAAARPAIRTYRGGTVRAELPAETVRAWELQVRRDGSTIASLLLGLHALAVHRYTRRPEMSVGLLLAGRAHPDTAEIVGMFNNYVPIRLTADSGASFRDFRRLAQDKLWEALRRSGVPYERLIELSGQRTDPSRNPLFDTMLVYHNQAESASVRFEAGGCRFVQLPAETGTAKLDLKLDVYPEPSGSLTCVWEYNERLLRRETAERLAEGFARLAESALRDPSARLADLEWMTDGERRQVVEGFNDTEAPYPEQLTLPAMFRQQAERTPDRVAAAFAEETLTYRELDERSGRIARALREGGLAPEEPVGLMA